MSKLTPTESAAKDVILLLMDKLDVETVELTSLDFATLTGGLEISHNVENRTVLLKRVNRKKSLDGEQ